MKDLVGVNLLRPRQPRYRHTRLNAHLEIRRRSFFDRRRRTGSSDCWSIALSVDALPRLPKSLPYAVIPVQTVLAARLLIADRPPHRSVRAELPHTAPA